MESCRACEGQGWYWVQDSPIEEPFQASCEVCGGAGEIPTMIEEDETNGTF